MTHTAAKAQGTELDRLPLAVALANEGDSLPQSVSLDKKWDNMPLVIVPMSHPLHLSAHPTCCGAGGPGGHKVTMSEPLTRKFKSGHPTQWTLLGCQDRFKGESVLTKEESVPRNGESVPINGESVLTNEESYPTNGQSVPTHRESVPTNREYVHTKGESVHTKDGLDDTCQCWPTQEPCSRHIHDNPTKQSTHTYLN